MAKVTEKAKTSTKTGTRGARPVPTFDHLKKRKPAQIKIDICLDPEVAERFAQAQVKVAAAQLEAEQHILKLKRQVKDTTGVEPGPAPEPEIDPALLAELEAARQELVENSTYMLFRALGRVRYDELQAEYPATPEQDAEHKENFGGKPAPYDTEKFPIALVAASCIEPELTYEQVEELFTEWPQSDMIECWMAALAVNSQQTRVDWGKAYG